MYHTRNYETYQKMDVNDYDFSHGYVCAYDKY